MPSPRQRIMAPPRFSPRSLRGLQFWFSAGSILGLADADPVSPWPDSSNNGYGAIEATNKPGYKINRIGGNKPSVLFDGTNDRLATPAVAHNIGTGDFTIYFVARSPNVGVAYKALISSGTFAPGIYIHATGRINFYLSTDHTFTPSTLSNNVWYLICVERVGTTVSCYVNGVADAITHTITTSIANAPWYIGNEDTGTSSTFNGDLAEIALYNVAHTIDQRGKVESYIRAQYGIF